jgi:hypothetical protein
VALQWEVDRPGIVATCHRFWRGHSDQILVVVLVSPTIISSVARPADLD